MALSSASSLISLVLVAAPLTPGQSLLNLQTFPNRSGLLATYNSDDQPIDQTGPFFQSLGKNGRTCNSCHQPAQGWSIAPDEVRARFDLSAGTDPLFRPVDGANCNVNIDTSTVAHRRKAYSLLIERGLIRVEMTVPQNAEFNVLSVQNPYGCGDTTALSMYRRPLPTTNLRALSTLMWDGRESSPQTGTQKINYDTNPADLRADLAHQVMSAVTIHAEGDAPSAEQEAAIVEFQLKLATAQVYDYRAGWLNEGGASGGPGNLSTAGLPSFFIGINDPLGGNPHGLPFDSSAMQLFGAWGNLVSPWTASREEEEQRKSIARGEVLFNTKPISITGVGGLNDDLNLPSIAGTCTTCHDTPNIGNHSVSLALNIGVSDNTSSLDLSYLPAITLQNKTTGEIKTTTDPGRALVTGLWKDVGRLKGPILRGLASRAPYFHNGSARSLQDLMEFYNTRFNIGLSDDEKRDLIVFLNAL